MSDMRIRFKILLRAELALLKIQYQRQLQKALCSAVALILLSIVLIMLNIGTFLLVAESVGYVWSAYALALGNALLATVPILLMRDKPNNAEEQMAITIRDEILEDLSEEAGEFKRDINDALASVKRFKQEGMLLGQVGLSALTPILTLLLQVLKKK